MDDEPLGRLALRVTWELFVAVLAGAKLADIASWLYHHVQIV